MQPKNPKSKANTNLLLENKTISNKEISRGLGQKRFFSKGATKTFLGTRDIFQIQAPTI